MRKFIVATVLALSVFVTGAAYNSSADEYYYGVPPGQLKRQWQGQYDAPNTTILKQREHRIYYVEPDGDVEYREYRYYVEPDGDIEYRYYVEPDGDVEYYYYYND